MNQHPEDTATNRFRTWWAGLLAALSFALITMLITSVAGNRLEPADILSSDVARAKARWTNLNEVTTAQTASVSKAGVADDASNTVHLPVDKVLPIATSHLNKKVSKSEFPVPGAVTEAPAEEKAAEPVKE